MTVATVEGSPEERGISPETWFLSSQTVFAFAILLSALALTYGVREYKRYHRWQRLEFLRQAVHQFEQDPEIRNALKILDFEEYRDYSITLPQSSEPVSFRVDAQLLASALAGHDERTRIKKEIDEKRAEGTLTEEELLRYHIATALRDWFNKMLNGLEHFGYFIESGLFTAKELRPWLIYWIRLIGDVSTRWEGSSKLYDQLYSYIHNYGFLGVQRLFERFGYRILPSPYKDKDFAISDPTQYSTKLALALAKASYLIYQDKKYVAEIARRWGIDIKYDFRYFNNRGRDTQAFILRTDRFMVLSFRGSQEMQDWFTNFNTKLRQFTIRKEGITTISSYKGKVHTGFFLGWASIERSVLEQIARWKTTCLKQGQALPPLLITGHSLGGALATMAAASLSENVIDVAGLYTFGQPRVGDWTFSRQLNKNLDGKIFRFVNNNDIVPHVPPPFSPWNPTRFYSHLGAIRYFDSKGLLVANFKGFNRAWDALLGLAKSVFDKGFDLIADHSMQYYISYLDKALQEEIEDRAAIMLETDKSRV
ncbi:MAG: lipase family protein [Leptolyngbya sp. SIO4C1]|nr:lipase family protein [Leptolyngbya sp. SIO4C1]